MLHFTVQIKASQVNYWEETFDSMKLKHEWKRYPPRIQVTVILTSADLVLKVPVEFSGSDLTSDSELKKVDILFPLGKLLTL